MRSISLVLAAVILGCATTPTGPQPATRWLDPAETKPSGSAPGAAHRLVGSAPDGTRTFVLVLATGDEVMSALLALARTENISNAHFTAIGGVHDPEIGFFDFERKQYEGMKLAEQTEVLSLLGDITLDVDGFPSVHAHATLGRERGDVFGGHLIAATVRPTLEVYVTAYATPLHKRLLPETNTQVIDLARTIDGPRPAP